MKKRLLRLLFLSGILVTLLSACEYDYIIPTPPPPVIANDTISYSQDIQPVFTLKCIACHAGSLKPDLTTGKSYSALMSDNFVVAGSPNTSVLYNKCKPGGSMATYTSADQLKLLFRWITAGAKND